MKRSWNRLYLRRCSTVSRGSQLGVLNPQRSFSLTTKASELSRLHSINKRYASGRQMSLSDPEQSVPFTSNIDAPADFDEGLNETYDSEPPIQPTTSGTSSSSAPNGKAKFGLDELELKINVVNIECQSRDGIRRNTTSLDIHAMKNGCTINSENIINNNIEETTLNDSDGEACK